VIHHVGLHFPKGARVRNFVPFLHGRPTMRLLPGSVSDARSGAFFALLGHAAADDASH